MKFVPGLLTLIVFLIGFSRSAPGQAECHFDQSKSILANDLVRVQLPKIGQSGPIIISASKGLVASDHWYIFSLHNTAESVQMFRSRGAVTGLEVLFASPDRVRVRLVRLPDVPAAQAIGQFELTYEIRRGEPIVRHEMVFRPSRPLGIANYQFFVTTEAAAATTHHLHVANLEWRAQSCPAASHQPYGRIEFSLRHPWVALERTSDNRWMSLGVPPADLESLQYAVKFRRYEVTRTGAWVTGDEPLHDFAWLAFGQNLESWGTLGRHLAAEVVRPSRADDAHPPAPQIDRHDPPEPFGVGINAVQNDIQVRAGGVMLTLDARSGAVRQLDAGAGNILSAPGGLEFSLWPKPISKLGPSGTISNLVVETRRLSYHWQSGGVSVENVLEPNLGKILWSATIANDHDEPLRMEARMSLPLRPATGDWFYWDGWRLRQARAGAPPAEMTTLVPGGYLSQGMFPAACLHDAAQGIALGLPPEQIESCYGSRSVPGKDQSDTFSYLVRAVVWPHQKRTVRFVLFPTDPNWNWRSCIERYWTFWPDVFAAPSRNDIWGLYGSANPALVNRQGDRFIELCRRLRVGPLEMYAPFNRTGEFYPAADPAYQRNDQPLSHEQMQRVYETANIAACNLSYVIPAKCDRELAQEKYADSMVHLADSRCFLDDEWSVVDKSEKLAAMFAWDDSFGRSLQADLRQIVNHYHPKGFYLDNGAFVWEDYGRNTPWSAFDDEGRIYSNAGIAYAMLLDDLHKFAPSLARNPGEFIQYFSGFRADFHLTNVTHTHPRYVRTHRLIMGYKPIYAGRQDDPDEAQLLDALELGALPWLRLVQPEKETFARTWAPVATALARAGWRPVPRAVCHQPGIRVERFGEQHDMFFTVRNLTDQPTVATLDLAGAFPKLADFSGHQRLSPRIASGGLTTQVAVEIPAYGFLVLRVEPEQKSAPTAWPAANFLAQAQPCSIILRSEASVDEGHIARRIKGFLEFQADQLGHAAAVEIVTPPATPAHPNRVIILKDTRTAIQATGPQELTVRITSDDESRALLSEFLDTLARR